MKITRVVLRFDRERDENEIVSEEPIGLEEALKLGSAELLRVEGTDIEWRYITHAARPFKGLVSARQFQEKMENLGYGDPIPDLTIKEFWNGLRDEERKPQIRHRFNNGKGGAYNLQLEEFGGMAKGMFRVSINSFDVGFVSPNIKLRTLFEKKFPEAIRCSRAQCARR